MMISHFSYLEELQGTLGLLQWCVEWYFCYCRHWFWKAFHRTCTLHQPPPFQHTSTVRIVLTFLSGISRTCHATTWSTSQSPPSSIALSSSCSLSLGRSQSSRLSLTSHMVTLSEIRGSLDCVQVSSYGYNSDWLENLWHIQLSDAPSRWLIRLGIYKVFRHWRPSCYTACLAFTLLIEYLFTHRVLLLTCPPEWSFRIISQS